MRKSRIRLYAPFIALVLIQGMIMVLAPSVGEQQELAFDADDGDTGGGVAAPAPEEGAQASGGTGAGAPGPGQEGTEDGDGAPEATNGDVGESGPAAPEETTADDVGADTDSAETGDDGATPAAGGDTGHCTDDGRQHGFFYHAPPCEPASDGANPGATYTGVTADEILVIQMYNAPHPLVDAIIPTDISDQDEDDFRAAAQDFINQHYELHGRELRLEAVRSSCPTTPPDPAKCREAARRVIDMDPFMVLWSGGSLYPAVFDEFARAGIIAVGGENFDAAFYDDRRPFRYNVSIDGTKMREHFAEYYCKKLARGKADRSGPVIHDEIGERGEVDRRYGIVTPDTPSDVANANALRDLIGECERQPPAIFTYELDIERGLEQATAVVAGLISEGVTTVTCICDPVAPQFLLDEANQQDWHPEHLMLGRFAIDTDTIGRIYDQDQWSRAFGPSQSTEPVPAEEGLRQRIWEGSGRDGTCAICQQSMTAGWNYVMAGHLLQAGGPSLDPGTVEQGAFEYGARGGWQETGGDPRIARRGLGQDDYTWTEDMREVYWDPDATSAHDGEQGAYVPVDGGRRYQLGEWTSDLNVPMP